MKTSKKHLFSILLVLVSIPVLQAQYGSGYGNGYGNGGYGRGRSAIPQAEEAEKKEEPKNAEQIVEAEMPALIEALELNEFEIAVLKTTLTKYVQEGIELRLLQLTPEKTWEGMESIALRQKEELKASLPEDKFEKLQAIQKEGYNKVKKKKKKDKSD
jgi:hypothetical protein